MEQSELMPAPGPPVSYEMNAPQYYATVGPDAPHPEYYSPHAGPPMPPPPPLPEPPGTSNVSLDPMLQQPPPAAPQPQASEAIINAAKAERSAQDRERGRLRVQRFRLKRKLADAEAGRRDKDTLKKIKFAATEQADGAGAGPSTARKPAVKDTEAELRERERGRLRVQAYRMRKKLAEAKDGLRDAETLKKIRTGKTGETPAEPAPALTPAQPTNVHYPPAMPSMMPYTPDPMFNVPVEAPSMLPPPPLPAPEQSETPTTSPRQRAVRTNWFHPSRWSTINAAGLRANFSSAHEIVRLAKLAPGGEETFKTLDRGTVHKWIDKERGTWSESVLEKVRKAAVKEAESWDREGAPMSEGSVDHSAPLDAPLEAVDSSLGSS